MPLCLTKPGPEDNPKAFLIIFESVTSAVGWIPTQWATFLAPHLTGVAQAAYQALPNEEACDYQTVKAAILDMLDITPKTFQCWFQGRLIQGTRPWVVVQELKDTC